MRFADLFCGTGGLSLGLARAGHEPMVGLDVWRPALAVYNANLPKAAGKAGETLGRELNLADEAAAIEAIRNLAEPVDLIAGGPPCQEFSVASRKRVEAERADLTPSFARIVTTVMPTAFVMENVPPAFKSPVYEQALGIYRAAGYGLTVRVMDSARCGVPQRRKRLICMGWKNAPDGFLESFLNEQLLPEVTIREHWSRQGLEIGFQDYYRHPHNYGKTAIFSVDALSPTVRGTNRPMPPDYPDRVVRMKDEGIFTEMPKNSAALPYSGVTCMKPAERGMLQGFPKDWDWLAAGRTSTVEQIIGNAVPVGMGEVIGRALAAFCVTPTLRPVAEPPPEPIISMPSSEDPLAA